MKLLFTILIFSLLSPVLYATQIFNLKAPSPLGNPSHRNIWVLDKVKRSANGLELQIYWRLGDKYTPSNKVLLQTFDLQRFKQTGQFEFLSEPRYTTYFTYAGQDLVAGAYRIYNVTTRQVHCEFGNHPYNQFMVHPNLDGSRFHVSSSPTSGELYYRTKDCSVFFRSKWTQHHTSYDSMMDRITWSFLEVSKKIYTYDVATGEERQIANSNVVGFDPLTRNVYTRKNSNFFYSQDDDDLYLSSFPNLTPIRPLVLGTHAADASIERHAPFLRIADADPKQGVYAVQNKRKGDGYSCDWDIFRLDLQAGSVVKKVRLPSYCLDNKQTQYVDTEPGRAHWDDPYPGDSRKWILDSANGLLFMQDQILDLKTETYLMAFPTCWSLKVNSKFNSGLCLNFALKDSAAPYFEGNVQSITVNLFDFVNRSVVNSATIPQDQVDFTLKPEQQLFLTDGVGALGWETAVTILVLK